jgi:hypothetical protein
MVKAKAKAFMVFYRKGARMGSVPYSKTNEGKARALMCLRVIQKDASGTRHYEITGFMPACRRARLRRKRRRR